MLKSFSNLPGKTLGLLSASCAWLEKYKVERMRSRENCKACGGKPSATPIPTLSELNAVDSKTELNVKKMQPSEISTCQTSIFGFSFFFFSST